MDRKTKIPKKQEDSASAIHPILFCFALAFLLIPVKIETQGEQRFRCISERINHLPDVVFNQVRLLIPQHSDNKSKFCAQNFSVF